MSVITLLLLFTSTSVTREAFGSSCMRDSPPDGAAPPDVTRSCDGGPCPCAAPRVCTTFGLGDAPCVLSCTDGEWTGTCDVDHRGNNTGDVLLPPTQQAACEQICYGSESVGVDPPRPCRCNGATCPCAGQCLNGGTCEERCTVGFGLWVAVGGRCQCAPPYTGRYCEMMMVGNGTGTGTDGTSRGTSNGTSRGTSGSTGTGTGSSSRGTSRGTSDSTGSDTGSGTRGTSSSTGTGSGTSSGSDTSSGTSDANLSSTGSTKAAVLLLLVTHGMLITVIRMDVTTST